LNPIPIIHIGPPKTASTSLQTAVIPKLDRPYQIGPDWCQALMRGEPYQAPPPLPDLIVSSESLGGFSVLPPGAIAERLAETFKTGRVIFVRRQAIELCYSLYRQRLINFAANLGTFFAAGGTPRRAVTIDNYFDSALATYKSSGIEYFAVISTERIRAAFEPHFEFKVIEYDLIKDEPAALARAFSEACGAPVDVELPPENKSYYGRMETILAAAPPEVPRAIVNQTMDYYVSSRLSRDREDFLRSWPATGRV